MTSQEIFKKFESLKNPRNIEGMKRFGIKGSKMYGIAIPQLRSLAKKIGKDHKLAATLWGSGIHEAWILASMVDKIEKVTEKQMDKWIKGFDSWDVCDQVCMNLFDKHPLAFKKALAWTERKEEFEKRAGFALMACLAFHDKKSPDSKFKLFFKKIKKHSTDERNFVKKAVNWALRQIGKRNKTLNKEAIKTVQEILKIKAKPAQWIAKDALRELQSPNVKKRLR